nr:DUF2058 family protein [Halomonas sp. 25-S5]
MAGYCARHAGTEPDQTLVERARRRRPGAGADARSARGASHGARGIGSAGVRVRRQLWPRARRQGHGASEDRRQSARIKRLYVTGAQQARLARGELEIARTRGRYRLIPAEVADRVEPMAPFLIAFRGGAAEGEDDPAYAEHPVPDDLMW